MKTTSTRFLRLLLACQLLVLAGCESVGGVVEGVGGAVGSAVDSAGTLFMNDSQRILRAGIQQYEEGQFDAATSNLRSALEGDLPTRDQVQAHKYLAFIACVTERTAQCRDEFRAALAIDPAMTLEPSEAGNPLWDPVFQAEKARVSNP